MISIHCNAESWFQHFITGSHSRPLLFCIELSIWFPKPTPNFMSLLTMGPHIQLYVDPTTCVFEISKIFRYEWNGNSLYFKLITHIVYYILIVKVKHIVTCEVKRIVYNFIINTGKKFQMTIRFCVVCVSGLCRFCTLWFSFRGTITVLSTVTKKHMSVVLCAFDGVLIKKVLKWVYIYLCMCCDK